MWRIYYYLSRFFYAGAVLMFTFVIILGVTASTPGPDTHLIESAERSWLYKITLSEANGGIADKILSAVMPALIVFAILGYWFDQKW